MATRLFRAGNEYASMGTTRYLTINSSQATKVTLTNGYKALSLFNGGSTPLIWGDTSISVNSGNYLYPSARIEWNPVLDSFHFYLISDSIGTTGQATIEEYK